MTAEPFTNSIVGEQGTLVRAQIKSPNFSLAGQTGWAILKNGNAYFFNITASGTITATSFAGSDFVINSAGAFFYSGAPAHGNLILSLAPASGSDSFGNAFPQGLGPTGGIPGSVLVTGSITATQIAANTITATQIAANTITAGQIAAGTITGTQIAASVALSAPVITGGTITGAAIVADGTSGQFLAYTGTPATGNLLASISGAAGSDSHSNAYLAGLQMHGSSGQYVLLNVATGVAYATFSTGATEEQAAAAASAFITNPGTSEIMRWFIDGPQSNVASHTDWVGVWLSSAAKDGSVTPGGSLVYTDTSSVSHLYANWGPKGFRMQSANPSDSNVYQGERQTIVLNGSLTVTTTTFQAVGAGFFIGVGQYIVEGQVMISPAAAGGTGVLEFSLGGGAVIGSSGITFSETLFGNPGSFGSWSFLDPAVGSSFSTATLTTARRLVTFRGTINVTTAGTLGLFVAEAGGGSFTVNSRTTVFHLYPVGP